MVNSFFASALAIIAVYGGYRGYCEWWDNPVVMSDVYYVIENPDQIHAGGLLEITSHFCQSRPAVPNSAVRTIANSVIYRLTDTTVANTQIGCGGNKHLTIQLPNGLTPGPHTYQFSATYQINPYKQEYVSAPPLEFEVVE